jgi:signal transduction histidine kinase
MRERAIALGGRVDITSAPGQGTTIEVSIPLELHVEQAAP